MSAKENTDSVYVFNCLIKVWKNKIKIFIAK